jgi:hypothetical protein
MLSCPRMGHVSQEFSCGEEGTGGFKFAAGVTSLRWIVGKHRHGRALTSSRPIIWDSSLPRGRDEMLCRPEDGWGGGPHDRLPRVKPGTGGSRLNVSVPIISCGAPFHAFDQPFHYSVTTHRHECLRHCAYGCRAGKLLGKMSP